MRHAPPLHGSAPASPCLARRLGVLVLLAGAGVGLATRAAASHCEPHPHSSCVPSNQQWLVSAPSHFAVIPEAAVLAGGSLSLALAGVYQHQPLKLEALSPDGAGREIPLVEHVVDTQALFAAGLGSGFEFTSALRLVTYQEGSGIGAARSRASSEPSLAQNAVRDPLFGIGYTLIAADPPHRRHALRLRSDFSLPLGDAQSFASEPGGVVAPAMTFQWRAGRFSVAGDAGLRLRRSATLADVRYGSQLSVAAGLAVEVLRDALFLAVEATALPGIGSPASPPDGAETRWIPAEWAFTVSLFTGQVYSLLASAGGGLPLSSRSGGTENSGFDADSFVGLGAPRVRSLLVLRVTSPSDG